MLMVFSADKILFCEGPSVSRPTLLAIVMNIGLKLPPTNRQHANWVISEVSVYTLVPENTTLKFEQCDGESMEEDDRNVYFCVPLRQTSEIA